MREKKNYNNRARQHFSRQPTRTRSRYLAASTAGEEQFSGRLIFHPISWRQLNNTYIRARLLAHTHTSCTCARTCIRTTYSYRHAQSGIKNDPPARAKLVKQPPAQRASPDPRSHLLQISGLQLQLPLWSFPFPFHVSESLGMKHSSWFVWLLLLQWPHTSTVHATHTRTKQNAVVSQPYIFRLSQFTYISIHATYRQNIHAAIACYMSRPQRLELCRVRASEWYNSSTPQM